MLLVRNLQWRSWNCCSVPLGMRVLCCRSYVLLGVWRVTPPRIRTDRKRAVAINSGNSTYEWGTSWNRRRPQGEFFCRSPYLFPFLVSYSYCTQLLYTVCVWNTPSLFVAKRKLWAISGFRRAVDGNCSSGLLRSEWWQFYSNVYPTRCNVTQFIICGNCSTCFGWYHHPSSGAQTTVSTASGICHAVIAICRYRGRVGR